VSSPAWRAARAGSCAGVAVVRMVKPVAVASVVEGSATWLVSEAEDHVRRSALRGHCVAKGSFNGYVILVCQLLESFELNR
jgi:hypothetical protein